MYGNTFQFSGVRKIIFTFAQLPGIDKCLEDNLSINCIETSFKCPRRQTRFLRTLKLCKLCFEVL